MRLTFRQSAVFARATRPFGDPRPCRIAPSDGLRCGQSALFLLFLSLVPASAANAQERWALSIEGHQTFVFGESGFGGGIRVPWEVVVQFDIQDGEFGLGSGSARWLDRATSVSAPAGWFDCRRVDGSYLDSNLQLHATPRVRFAAFPVAGAVRDGRVVLEPGYRPPGNYLAVTYRCETDNSVGDNWFGVAERAKQVHGKRQDVETQHDEARQSARVREVAALPPEGLLDLPLVDGWVFIEGSTDSERQVRYTLRRVE